MVYIFDIVLSAHQKQILNQIQIEHSVDPFYNVVHDHANKWMPFDGNVDKIIFKGIQTTSSKNSDALCYTAAHIIAELMNTLRNTLKKP